jgi:hypothetical protein
MSKSVRQIIISAYAKELEELAVWNELCEFLSGWEGKQNNRRLFTYLGKMYSERYPEAQLPGIYYEPGYLSKIVMWGGFTKVAYENRYYFHLPRESPFTMGEFRKRNTSYSVGAAERQAKREELLNTNFPEKVETLINEHNAVMKLLSELIPDRITVPDVYEIEKEKEIKL